MHGSVLGDGDLPTVCTPSHPPEDSNTAVSHHGVGAALLLSSSHQSALSGLVALGRRIKSQLMQSTLLGLIHRGAWAGMDRPSILRNISLGISISGFHFFASRKQAGV